MARYHFQGKESPGASVLTTTSWATLWKSPKLAGPQFSNLWDDWVGLDTIKVPFWLSETLCSTVSYVRGSIIITQYINLSILAERLYPLKIHNLKPNPRTFLAVQWLGIRASKARRSGSIPVWGTKTPHVMWLAKKERNLLLNEMVFRMGPLGD